MGLYNSKTNSKYSFNQGSWAPGGSDWEWKYTGDIVDKHMWRMKKEAQAEQEHNAILNKYSVKIKSGEMTADDIVKMVNENTVPQEDVAILKKTGSRFDIACFGVYNGHIWEDLLGKDGWPTLKYVYNYIRDNFSYRDGGDIDACYTDENNLRPSEIYVMLDQAIYQNNIGRSTRY